VEVERPKRAVRSQLRGIVADKELPLEEENVGLDTREAVAQGIEKRPRVVVIVVGVGALEGRKVARLRFLRRGILRRRRRSTGNSGAERAGRPQGEDERGENRAKAPRKASRFHGTFELSFCAT